MRVDGQASKDWVRENYSKLTKFTLLDSDKALNLVNNVYESGMNAELEILLKNLQSRDPGDVYSNDLLASFYLNTNQLDKELEIREELRQLDPINYQLELVLARAYARGGDIANLEDSVKRIRVLAPDSQEFKDAQELLTQSKATP
jgi:predicted Zn-dependent protease